jgi:exodeoxyribonuclease VII large subunit
LLRRVALARERLLLALSARLEAERARLEALLARRAFARPLEPVERRRQELADQQDRLLAVAGRTCEHARQRLSALVGRLDALSPLSVLARGYAVVTREPDAVPVRSRADVAPGDRLRIRLRDGDLAARVLPPGEPGERPEESEMENR